MYAYVNVTTQTEFAAAITAGDYPHITNDGRYEVPADVPRGHTIKVSGAAKPRIVTYGTSSPSIVTSGTSSPRIETSDSSSPSIVTSDSSSPSIVTSDSSSPSIETYGTSSPSIVTSDSSSPSIVTSDSSSPRIVTSDSSSPRIVTSDSSSPRIVTSDSSSPSIVTSDSSSPSIVTSGTSSPSIETYGTSSPRIETSGGQITIGAHDYVNVLITGNAIINADANATVRARGSEPIVNGGALTQRAPLTTNPQLVRQVLTHIETHPDEWNQGSWASQTPCGTTYCYAGHAVAMSGGVMNIDDSTVEVATLPESVRLRFVREHVQISAAARALLGLDSLTADRLFGGSNDLGDLHDLVDEICGGAEPVPVDAV